MHECASAFIKSVFFLARKYPDKRIRIVGIPGNHGESRTHRTSLHPIKDNYDTQVYVVLHKLILLAQEEYKDLANVSIEYASTEYQYYFEVKGWTFMAIHEMNRNILAPTAKASVLGVGISDNVDVILTGHWHETIVATLGNIKVVRNGSTAPEDKYAKKLMIPKNFPEQTVLVVSPEESVELFKIVQIK
jgi:predicted phosphodiesterase